MEELLNNIGNFGFPIVVTIFLLVRIENKLEKLSLSIEELSKAILSIS